MILHHRFEPVDNARLANLNGPLEAHLRRIEQALGVTLKRRAGHFEVQGAAAAARQALAVLVALHEQADQPLGEEQVQWALVEAQQALAAGKGGRSLRGPAAAAHPAEQGAADGADLASGAAKKVATKVAKARGTQARPEAAEALGRASGPRTRPVVGLVTGQTAGQLTGPAAGPTAGHTAGQAGAPTPDGDPVLHTRRADLRGRTPNQVRYLRQMLAHDITFGIGPAGTGKTFLAVACAVDALQRQGVQRIVLTRPAVEAGERLGFLPGDLAQKVDPYLRPLYDALYDLMGFDRVQIAFEKGQLEIAPLAFMRGRTLNHAFVILDEAQNTTTEQMKMFLTRMGFGSRAVVTGDVSQIDLPKGMTSGLVDAERVLQGVDGIAFTRFTAADVVRHPLVARIVQAYDAAAPREAPPRRRSPQEPA